VERLLADLNVAYEMPFIALRYFNAAGADPEGAIGEAHAPETHLIPLVINAAGQDVLYQFLARTTIRLTEAAFAIIFM